MRWRSNDRQSAVRIEMKDRVGGETSNCQSMSDWGVHLSDGKHDESFSGFVQMRGAEYFFAPSISFLKSL
jgi:hypothetical protein